MSGLQALGMGLNGAGGAMQAGSAISAGNQANTIGKVQQGQLIQNADLLDYSANTAEAAGINAASAAKRKNQFVQSRIIALNAAGGGSSTEKNVAELLANTSAEGEYDALNSIYEGSTRATSLRNEAISNRNQGMVARYQGKQAQQASKAQAISSLIGTGSNMASFANKYSSKNSIE